MMERIIHYGNFRTKSMKVSTNEVGNDVVFSAIHLLIKYERNGHMLQMNRDTLKKSSIKITIEI